MLHPHPLALMFPPMSAPEFNALKADIEHNGLRVPITLHEGKILDGLNRARACAALDIEPDTREYNGLNPLAFVLSQNLHRRHLNESQRALIAAQLADKKNRGGRPRKNQEKPVQICTGFSQNRAASEMRVSRRAVADAAKVLSEAAPAVIESIRSGLITVADATQILDATPTEQQQAIADVQERRTNTALAAIKARRREHLKNNPRPLPDGQYRCVVIDPPWPTQKLERDLRPNQIAFGYETMELHEIAQLPIHDTLARHAWVFLWTTQRFLPDSFELLRQWGLRYRFTMVWNKPAHVGFRVTGLPRYSCEFVVVGAWGKPEFVDLKAFDTTFEGAHEGHSVKPQAFYDTLNRVCEGPRLDLFNRRRIEGFDGWGAESDEPGA